MTERALSVAPVSNPGNGSLTSPSLEFLPQPARDFAAVAAETAEPVMIYGETGTGKTYLARIIHQMSDRRRQPFVQVDCGAIPETLFEHELFGHVRGAFTGADQPKGGLLEAANGGTLFLDELGELPPHLQTALLRVLDDGTFRRIGSSREIRLDSRVISATNRDIDALVRSGQFREDLLYRCRVPEFRLAPLRDRMDEFDRLAGSVLRHMPARIRPPGITDTARRVLRSYDWPGNLRELDHALRHATAYARGQPIEPAHLPERIRSSQFLTTRDTNTAARNGRRRYSAPGSPELEIDMIRRALRESAGNKAQAARKLGMSTSTLWAKLLRYADHFGAAFE